MYASVCIKWLKGTSDWVYSQPMVCVLVCQHVAVAVAVAMGWGRSPVSICAFSGFSQCLAIASLACYWKVSWKQSVPTASGSSELLVTPSPSGCETDTLSL